MISLLNIIETYFFLNGRAGACYGPNFIKMQNRPKCVVHPKVGHRAGVGLEDVVEGADDEEEIHADDHEEWQGVELGEDSVGVMQPRMTKAQSLQSPNLRSPPA